jgi:hypothetical protein
MPWHARVLLPSRVKTSGISLSTAAIKPSPFHDAWSRSRDRNCTFAVPQGASCAIGLPRLRCHPNERYRRTSPRGLKTSPVASVKRHRCRTDGHANSSAFFIACSNNRTAGSAISYIQKESCGTRVSPGTCNGRIVGTNS